MGITLYSYTSKLKARHAAKLRANCIIREHHKIRTPTAVVSHIQHHLQVIAYREKQDKLEERLHEIQERVYLTRHYIHAIRHEYEGASREAIDHYVSIINTIYSNVISHYMRNIKYNDPVLEEFLEQVEDEYMELVLEGGFTEEEAYDYIYGYCDKHQCTTDDEVLSVDEADEVISVLNNMTL